jgi:hypothetical protein
MLNNNYYSLKFINFFLYRESSVLFLFNNLDELSSFERLINKPNQSKNNAIKVNSNFSFTLIENVFTDKNITGKTFDSVIFLNTLGNSHDVIELLTKVHKVTHSNTKIIFSYYNYLWAPLLKVLNNKKNYIQNWLTKSDVTNFLNIAGYEIIRYDRKCIIPFTIFPFSKFINNYFGSLPFISQLCLNNFVSVRKNFLGSNNFDYPELSVSIIIPARNESGNIQSAVDRIPFFGSSQEIIFVEGGSTDNTWEQIITVSEKHYKTRKIISIKQNHKGKADAVRAGFAVSTSEILMILDADLTVPPEQLPQFYKAIKEQKGEFIMGSRLVYPMEKQAMRTLNVLGNKFFSAMFSWILTQPIRDTLCGTKVLLRSDYVRIVNNRDFFGDFDPFGDFDLIFGAFKLNLKILELPIHYKERTYGNTNISRFKHGLILLRMTIFASRKIKFIWE